jgi:hypothetical protein
LEMRIKLNYNKQFTSCWNKTCNNISHMNWVLGLCSEFTIQFWGFFFWAWLFEIKAIIKKK